MKSVASVDDFIAKAAYWQPELQQLRQILITTDLQEAIKWGSPCYSFQDKNVVGIGAFKAYFGLWFYQGALLPDKRQVLINAQAGKTKALRQWRMTSADEIVPATIKSYVKQAIQLVKDGVEIKADRSQPIIVPPELKQALKENPQAAAQFKQFTKGIQRQYTGYIAEAKREETKLRRLEKILPLIQAGKGLHDHYR